MPMLSDEIQRINVFLFKVLHVHMEIREQINIEINQS